MFLNSQIPTYAKLRMINYHSSAQIVAVVQMVAGVTLLVYSISIGASLYNEQEDFTQDQYKWEVILYFILASAYFILMGMLLYHAVLKKNLRSSRYWCCIGGASVICSVIVQSVIWETQDDLIPFQLKALAEVTLVLNMFMVLIGVGYYKELSNEAENSPIRFTKPKSNGISLPLETQKLPPAFTV